MFRIFRVASLFIVVVEFFFFSQVMAVRVKFIEQVSNAALELKTQLGHRVFRVLTQRQDQYQTVDPDHKYCFMSGHWTKSLSLVPQKNKNFLLSDHTDLALFHEELGERLIKSKKAEINKSLQRDGYTSVSVTAPNSQKIEGAFSEGHCAIIGGRTKYHKVFLSLYEEKLLTEKSKDPIKLSWFVPIEELFLFENLEKYKEGTALLNHWRAYSRFALVVLPKDTQVTGHMGIAAHQTPFPLPKTSQQRDSFHLFSENSQKVIDKAKETLTLHSFGKFTDDQLKANLWRYGYTMPGGALQFYLETASQFYIYDIQALYEQSPKDKELRAFFRNFSKEKKDAYTWQPVSQGQTSHFFCDDENVKIKPHRGLSELIDDFKDEEKDIENILECVRDSSSRGLCWVPQV